MAMIWGVIWGALLGMALPGGEFTTMMGAFFGFFAGWSLRFVIRALVTQQREELRSELLAQINALPRLAEKSSSEVPAASASLAEQTSTPTAPNTLAANIAAAVQRTSIPTSEQQATQEQRRDIADDQAFWNDEAKANNTDALQNAQAQLSASEAAKAQAAPTAPAGPNMVDQIFDAAKGWLFGGNTIVRVGLVILFIGLSFLARYAAASGLLPVELRLTVIGAFGIALLAIGFKKRFDKPGFALGLQGAGVAVMYLTVFAAFKLYDMLPALLAFAFMIIVCALSCALALLQSSRALAFSAFAGGFAVPILLSTGQGSHVGLFSYYTVLNLAILFIAYKKSWRILNLLGFVATFGVAIAWGAIKFAPEQYASTQPFLIGFLLIYVITAVLYARNTPTKLGNAIDSTLVFGAPLIAFGLQAGLTQQFELGTAFSALGFGLLYIGLATVLSRHSSDNYRLLIECFIAIGVGFATLAVPLALDAQWTSAVWALEGAGAFWVGMRQARWMPRAFGLALQAVAAFAFITTLGHSVSSIPLLNPRFLGAVLIALPALMIAWWLRKDLPHSGSRWAQAYAAIEARLSSPVFLYGFAWWCFALVIEIYRTKPAIDVAMSYAQVLTDSTAQLLSMMAILASAFVAQRLSIRKKWTVADWPSRLTLIVLTVTFVLQLEVGARVLHLPALLVWPVALALHFYMLRINDQHDTANPEASLAKLNHGIHVGGVWLITALLADCIWYWIGKGDLLNTSWASVVLLISSVGVLLLLSLWAGRANQHDQLSQFKWPLNPHALAYYWHAALPLAAAVFIGALVVAVSSSGRTDPLPYIPLINPTDLTLAIALGGLVFWRRALISAKPAPPAAQALRQPKTWAALAALAFIAINTIWLRVAHHFFSVPWDAGALFASFVVQTGYAILWTVLALSIMVIAGNRKQRTLWLVGAGLLGVVVVKLLLVDLSNAGGAERIIAFIVVGVLMLVVGYFAPLPPKAKTPATDSSADSVATDPTSSVSS
jgi:uncharacterized membrane protein